MTIEDLRRIVSQITYKPGYRFEIIDRDRPGSIPYYSYGLIDIVLHAQVPDAVDPGRSTHLRFYRQIDCFLLESMTEKAIVGELILHLVRELEDHEIAEWYKYRGAHVRDPHPELKEAFRIPVNNR